MTDKLINEYYTFDKLIGIYSIECTQIYSYNKLYDLWLCGEKKQMFEKRHKQAKKLLPVDNMTFILIKA